MAENSPQLIAVGRIGKPVGLRGMCRVFPMGSVLTDATYPMTLQCGRGRNQQQVELTECKPAGKEMLKVQFAGITSREAVDLLKNNYLYVPVDELPEVDSNEYYFYQLKDLRVVDDTGAEVGKVVEVYNFPTSDALEISLLSNGEKVLYPFRSETIVSVSLEDGVVTIKKEFLLDLM